MARGASKSAKVVAKKARGKGKAKAGAKKGAGKGSAQHLMAPDGSGLLCKVNSDDFPIYELEKDVDAKFKSVVESQVNAIRISAVSDGKNKISAQIEELEVKHCAADQVNIQLQQDLAHNKKRAKDLAVMIKKIQAAADKEADEKHSAFVKRFKSQLDRIVRSAAGS